MFLHRLICVAAVAAGVSAQTVPPRATIRDTVEDYHGKKISDPYRWMENMESPEFQSWLKGQNEYARATLSAIPGREQIAAQLNQAMKDVVSVQSVSRAADRLFYMKTQPGEDVAKLYVRHGGKERLLIDPMARGAGGKHQAIDFVEPSPDGKFVAYGQSSGGSEDSVLRILETASGRDLGEAIDRRPGYPEWRPNGRSFFYTRMAKQAPGAPLKNRYLNAKSYLHVLGRNPDEDLVVLARGLNPDVEMSETDMPVTLARAGKYAFGVVVHGTKREMDLYIAPLEAVTGSKTEWRKVAGATGGVLGAEIIGDDLYVLTNRDAPRSKIVRTSASKPDLAHAEVVAPQMDARIVTLKAAQDGLYIGTMDGGIGGLLRLPHGGAKLEPIALPFDGSIKEISAARRRPGVIIKLASWTQPEAIFEYDPARQKMVDMGLQPASPVDLSGYESVEVKAKSHDGVMIPLSIVYRKGFKREGSAPVFLHGYGAYGTAEDPRFLAKWLPWLERGGVYAMAHVRGGGEYGTEWHAAGQMQNKPNTWLDAIACARYLVEQGYTAPKRIAILGGSAGGIYAGGAITEAPELFGAAVIRVGITDTLRYEIVPTGPANTAEFGTVKTPEGFAALLAMSPYHRVREGVDYPPVLLTTGLNDPRVPSWQPAKMAARLQAVSKGKPVLLRVEYDGGHGYGSTQTQSVEEWADIFAFLFRELGQKASHAN